LAVSINSVASRRSMPALASTLGSALASSDTVRIPSSRSKLSTSIVDTGLISSRVGRGRRRLPIGELVEEVRQDDAAELLDHQLGKEQDGATESQ
jgi:hypothetical protein